jgi:Na+/H+ antiporter NhaD/arsenite permease-like protein
MSKTFGSSCGAHALAVSFGAMAALAAGPAAGFDPNSAVPQFLGAGLSILWAVPFAGLLLSLAIWPLVASRFWHGNYGKIAAGWVVAFLVPSTAVFGASQTAHHVLHALLLEYLPFLIVLFALYTIAGGIAVRGTLVGSPGLNTGILALGGLLASVMGTTGAAMLLIRPLLRANETRTHRVHAVVFFIILVGNIGGALTPLGDPPLFIGFLKGIDFFWTTRGLAMPTLVLASTLLALFYAIDTYLWRSEERASPATYEPLAIEGAFNFALIGGVVGVVLLSGTWDPDTVFDVAGTPLELENAVRDIALVVLALLSLALTPRAVREHNAFSWGPIGEVAKLFAAIFVTIIPVIAILQAGRDGALAAVVELVTDSASAEPRQAMYFWVTGILSAFLDNAPTYLVFFNLAGGDPVQLMGPLAPTLAAISAGAVYFGALTYVGNAPNFMIKAIAENRGVAMPSFFGYLAWSLVIVLPLLAAASWLFL